MDKISGNHNKPNITNTLSSDKSFSSSPIKPKVDKSDYKEPVIYSFESDKSKPSLTPQQKSIADELKTSAKGPLPRALRG